VAKSILPEFADYHRTVIGFHGTTAEIANRLVAGEPFRASDNEDDWLGIGNYFWEWAPQQAWWWSKKFKRYQNPRVVGAIIRLGHCFDLLDPKNVRVLKGIYPKVIDKYNNAGMEAPTNARQYRKLDCAVFNYFYEAADAAKEPVDSVRGVFVPASGKKRIWKGSWIYDDSHIQINVRNTQNILAVWHVRPNGRYGTQEED
jgi:hypothetical protein